MPSEDKHIWKRHMRIEVEIRRRGTQDGETPLEARKRQGRIVRYRFQREHGPAKHHDVGLLAPMKKAFSLYEKINSYCFKSTSSWHFVQKLMQVAVTAGKRVENNCGDTSP